MPRGAPWAPWRGTFTKTRNVVVVKNLRIPGRCACAPEAHDLRTPLASLQLTLEHAANRADDPSTKELLASALNDVVYLAALTNNLRLASQFRDGWDPQSDSPGADLKDVAERVVTRTSIFAKQRGIALEAAFPDGPVFVHCHPVAAEQTVSNIVENAVIYGHKGGHVAVVLDQETRGFRLRISDDGPGVPPAELPRLGQRTFRSTESRERDPRGSGLGLAISAEVCRRCGWTLQFVAETPVGLRVQIEGASISPFSSRRS